jgi:hypothetical protein
LKEKMPILAHGELYIEGITKSNSGGAKSYPHEYNEAREKVLNDIVSVQSRIDNNPELFLDEKVICVRLEPKFEAKSYAPDNIASISRGMRLIGGRKYAFSSDAGVKAKLYYLRTDNAGIDKLRTVLELGLKDNQTSWKQMIQSINRIDIMESSEKIMGFSDEWEEGYVEFVLHPLGDDCREDVISSFLRIANVNREDVHLKTYEDGLTFVGTRTNRKSLELMANFNPLRSVHPIEDIDLQVVRNISAPGPHPPKTKINTGVIVGAFDTGIDDKSPYFDGFARNTDLVVNSVKQLLHGSGVAGALLYGNITKVNPSDVLPSPLLSVEMFRVLPEDGTTYAGDPVGKLGLYETIDKIENIVKKHPEIKLYNLSIGPYMPIIDDEINRFTYALDRLSYNVGENEVNPLFTVACGNDGYKPDDLCRIQPPSDMVNGLAVGAYTFTPLNEPCRAGYSCIGPGREGGKIKPDVLDFGGSTDRPFIAISSERDKIVTQAGTSFAAPLVMHKIGNMMAMCNEILPHMGRTLIIHTANLEAGKVRNNYEGYGFVSTDIESILECTDNKVTILYQGELMPGATAKLPIFAPRINEVKGNVAITWTITTIVSPDIKDIDAYTNNGIEDTFYPHSEKYTFRKGRNVKKLNLLEAGNNSKMTEYMNLGYIKSTMPDSMPGKICKDECALRNSDLKWDTVIKKHRTLRGPSVYNPFITLHAMGRNGFEDKYIRYFMAVTIEAPKYNGSLYNEIVRAYPLLNGIKLNISLKLPIK